MSIRLFARATAGLSLCAAALLTPTAQAYSGLVVFGDSLSDGGNNAALLTLATGGVPPVSILGDGFYTRIPSSFGTYSNGPVWTQYLAQSLNLTLLPSVLGGTNYAFGGAETGVNGNDIPQIPGFPFSMRTQLNSYLGDPNQKVDPNALYILSGGGNNVRNALEMIGGGADPMATSAAAIQGYAADMAGLVKDLKLAGAQHVLVMNTPNFGLTPLAGAMGIRNEATWLSAQMNTALDAALQGSGAMRFDMFSFLTATVAAGPASGFSDLSHACGAVAGACETGTWLFWDGIHPTTVGHAQLAAAVGAVVAVPEPGTYALMALGLAVVALGARRRAVRHQG